MASILHTSISSNIHNHQLHLNSQTSKTQKQHKFQCKCSKNSPQTSSKNKNIEPENLVLKIAWYSSELLGVGASLFRSRPKTESKEPKGGLELAINELGMVDQELVVEAIKEDFQRCYFVTGNLSLDAYEEDCEFADPAGSFKGLSRFKRNCTNFGSLLQKSNMKLMKWEDFQDKSIGHWRFSCVLSFPWKPILSATGYTEYFFDENTGKVCRHVEHWNVPKMTLLKQILKPSRQKKKD